MQKERWEETIKITRKETYCLKDILPAGDGWKYTLVNLSPIRIHMGYANAIKSLDRGYVLVQDETIDVGFSLKDSYFVRRGISRLKIRDDPGFSELLVKGVRKVNGD